MDSTPSITYTIELACRCHEGQTYGGKNYVNGHLQPVSKEAHLVLIRQESNIDPLKDYRLSVSIIGWLHDILEDTDMTAQGLRSRGYPDEVVDAVVAITKVEGESRKEYLRKCKDNYLALVVKKADTMVNLTNSYKEGNYKRIKKYTEQLAFLFKEE